MKAGARVAPAPPRSWSDRWLFGYADVVTLLFACFASLYAAEVASRPVHLQAATDIRLDDERPRPTESDLERRLIDAVGEEPGLPGLDVRSGGRGIVISLPEAGSFPAGRAEVSPEAERVMRTLAASLRDVPNAIVVEGHTDDVPIRNEVFASNWELSSARATRVVELLIDAGVAPERLSAAGLAEYRPRVPNTTPEARARNRRVDVVVLDPSTPVDGLPTGARGQTP